MELLSDKELIEDYLLNRSENAASVLVNRHMNFLFSSGLRLTNSFDDTEDLVQDTFFNAFKHLHRFEFKSSFKTWLYRILYNLFLNDINKKKRYKYTDIDDYIEELSNYHNPETDIEDEELEIKKDKFLKDLKNIIQELPQKQRDIFCMRYFDQMKYEEISEILGISVGGLKANYHNAIKSLSKIVNK